MMVAIFRQRRSAPLFSLSVRYRRITPVVRRWSGREYDVIAIIYVSALRAAAVADADADAAIIADMPP